MKRSERRDVLRAVIDTNIWVSAVLNPAGPPAQVLNALISRQFVSISSEPLLEELDAVLARPRIATRYNISQPDRRDLIDLLRTGSVIIPVAGTVQLCRDPDDDVVIETALRGKADALVSRDDDLKGAGDVVEYLDVLNIRVMTVRRFLELVETG